jgi:hypothetical protein
MYQRNPNLNLSTPSMIDGLDVNCDLVGGLLAGCATKAAMTTVLYERIHDFFCFWATF